jgi:hypothetical protein
VDDPAARARLVRAAAHPAMAALLRDAERYLASEAAAAGRPGIDVDADPMRAFDAPSGLEDE